MREKQNERMERLPDSELAVMCLIWEEEKPVGTGYLAEILGEQRGWTRSTIQVLLARLEEKGFLTCQKEGRRKLYRPRIAMEDYRRSETKTFLERFYHNSYKGLITALVEEENLTEEDAQELMDIIKNS